MKQRITSEQLAELTDAERETIAPFVGQGEPPLLSLGQMMAFLDAKAGKEGGWHSFWERERARVYRNALNEERDPCDVLWDAVKEVLRR